MGTGLHVSGKANGGWAGGGQVGRTKGFSGDCSGFDSTTSLLKCLSQCPSLICIQHWVTLAASRLFLLLSMMLGRFRQCWSADLMPDNYGGSNGTCLLSTPSLYLSHSGFVPMNVIWVCVCVCACVCVWDCYRWPPSRWENAGSLLVCVHMYQTQHVFPFQRRGILCVRVCVGPHMRLCVCVCVCVCVYVANHTGRLTSRNPCSKNRHCVFPALTHRYHRTHTHTHTHTRIIALFSFPLAGFLNAYPCASGRQDVSLWLSWENSLSGNKPEDTNRRGVTASSRPPTPLATPTTFSQSGHLNLLLWPLSCPSLNQATFFSFSCRSKIPSLPYSIPRILHVQCIYSHILCSAAAFVWDWQKDPDCKKKKKKMEVEHRVLALCLRECQRLYQSIFPLRAQCNPPLKHSR